MVMTRIRMAATVVAFGLAVSLLPHTAKTLEAQLQDSIVAGRVLSPDGLPFPRAQVVLRDGQGRAIDQVQSDDDGRFRIRTVAPGVYQLGAESGSLRTPWHRL